MKDVLLVGAGHAHVEVLRRFGKHPLPSVRLTLLTHEAGTPYSGMLPGVVAEHYKVDDAHIDTGRLSRFTGARLLLDEATGIDLSGRRVLCREGPPVPFDLLSLDIRLPPEHCQHARRQGLCHPGQVDRRLPRAVRGRAGAGRAVPPRPSRRRRGARLAADEILWASEAAPASWLAGTGLPLDAEGFLRVDATLRAAGGVFAAGDMIAYPGSVPRSGVYAVRAGPVLAANIRAALTGGRLRPHRPQADALAIVTTGGRHAVLTRNGITLEGGWAWRLKDWIDRRWMARCKGVSPA